MITDESNVVFLNLDGKESPETELLSTVIAFSNSGGGIIYAEHENFCGKYRLTEYIVENTYPSVFPIIDKLFPETVVRITVLPRKQKISSADGSVFILGRNYRPLQLYPCLSGNDTAEERFFCEQYNNVFDKNTVKRAAYMLGKRRKFRGIDNFDNTVFLKTVSAIRTSKLGLLPTASGILLFGTKESIRKFLPNSGVEYTLYGPKRETFKKLYFSGMTLMEQKNAVYYEIIRDSECCMEASSFLYSFSFAFTAAAALRGSRKESPIKIYNRNGLIEISFSTQREKSEKLNAEVSPFRTEIGKILKLFGIPYFSENAFGEVKIRMQNEGFSPPTFEDRISTTIIKMDFKHRKRPLKNR